MPNLSSQVAVLEKKSKENYECFILADKGSYFNVAVTRLYFCCLLLAKRCAYDLNWLKDQDFSDNKSNTHQLIETGYVDRMIQSPGINDANIAKLKHFRAVKTRRKEAEYSGDKDFCCAIHLSDYNYCKDSANKFIEAIEDIHSIKIK